MQKKLFAFIPADWKASTLPSNQIKVAELCKSSLGSVPAIQQIKSNFGRLWLTDFYKVGILKGQRCQPKENNGESASDGRSLI